MIKDLHEMNRKKRWAYLQYGHTANCDLLNNESEVWGCTSENAITDQEMDTVENHNQCVSIKISTNLLDCVRWKLMFYI